MELAEIKDLVERYQEALRDEFATARVREMLWLVVLTENRIDGSNADERKMQTARALAGAEDYKQAVVDAADAENSRLAIEAEIGLTKAWLNSQSGG
jgi:short-subunit dehydrogenase